jgi:hypothetical protein
MVGVCLMLTVISLRVAAILCIMALIYSIITRIKLYNKLQQQNQTLSLSLLPILSLVERSIDQLKDYNNNCYTTDDYLRIAHFITLLITIPQ